MKNPPEVKTGDRVRVVLEGEARAFSIDTEFVLGAREQNAINPADDHVVSVEVLPPPVEVFGPGDKLGYIAYKGKRSAPRFTLGHGGYFAHWSNRWTPSTMEFTSVTYERVDDAR